MLMIFLGKPFSKQSSDRATDTQKVFANNQKIDFSSSINKDKFDSKELSVENIQPCVDKITPIKELITRVRATVGNILNLELRKM